MPPAAPPPPDVAARLSRLRHDLRTPLNHIMGYSELLQEDAPAALQPDLQRIHTAARTLLAGVDEALGLVREIVEGGASAVPTLPPAAAASGPREGPPSPAPTAAGRLLVVDDDELNRTLMARRFERQGHAVDVAEDGPRALERIAAVDYDLILLDIMMPGMSGLEVLRRVRERHAAAELPVIMATAMDASDDVVEALALGANDYVTKPINLPVVAARVRTQLELRRAHQEIRRLLGRLESRSQFIRETFGRYLSDEVVANLLERPEGLALGGETRTATILMSDLRGFSGLAGRLPPAQVIAALNHYLGVMTEIIQRHGGTIDEFIGDAILVIFGAPTLRPDDALRGVACALEMQLAMARVNAHAAGLGLPRLEMGIGLNTGEVVVGNIGSERRAKYGVVGLTVNLCSRIQAYAVGGQVLASAATLAAAGDAVGVRGAVEVYPKGSRQAVRLHEVSGVAAPYSLELPDQAGDLTELTERLAVRFAILDGNNAPAPHLPGRATHLSRRAARIVSTAVVEPLRALKLELWRQGQPLVGDIYARVLAAEDDGHTLTVRFTSVTPGAEAAILELLAP